MMVTNHCSDNSADRDIGKFWERQFCVLAADLDKSFSPLQIGRKESAQAFSKRGHKWNSYTLPDVTVWTYPGEHHEVKHKNPTRNLKFGLEVYRFNALLWLALETKQDVMYTIHNWELAGGRDIQDNRIEHWATASLMDLNNQWAYQSDKYPSWVNGIKKNDIPQYFWPVDLWMPLSVFWKG